MLRYLSVEFRGFAVSRRLLRTVAVLPLFTIGSSGISAFAQTSKSELEPLADAVVVPQKAETVQEDLVQSVQDSSKTQDVLKPAEGVETEVKKLEKVEEIAGDSQPLIVSDNAEKKTGVSSEDGESLGNNVSQTGESEAPGLSEKPSLSEKPVESDESGPSEELSDVIEVLHESARAVGQPIEATTEVDPVAPSGSFLRITEPVDYRQQQDQVDQVLSPSDIDVAATQEEPSLKELRQMRAAELARLRSLRLQQQIRSGYSALRPKWNAIPMMSSRYRKPVIYVPVF